MSKQRTGFGGEALSELNSMIFIGDLARAFDTLKPDDTATAKAIAEALGFAWRSDAPPATNALSDEETRAAIQRAMEERRKREPSKSVEEKPKIQPSQDWVPGEMIAQGKDTAESELGVEPLSLAPGDSEYVAPPLEPLFAPPWTRAILSGALATESDDGPLDLERLIDSIARRERLQTLPRLPVPTLRRGVQLLIDASQAMLPFDQDQHELALAIQNVVGKDNLSVRRFAGCPTRGVWIESNVELYTDSDTPPGYIAPPAGTLVLLLSDLGLTRPRMAQDWASVEEWSEFARAVQRAGCPLIAFVPYAEKRWNRRLRGLIRMIPWDRTTTAGIAQKFARAQRRIIE